MQYQTTRSNESLYTFSEAVRESIPREGGLFVPSKLPKFSDEFLDSLMELSFLERTKKILAIFASDLTEKQVENICNKAFAEENFTDQVIYQSKTLSPYLENPAFVFLDHGPSASYLDLAQAFSAACLTVLSQPGEQWYLVAGDSLQNIKSLVSIDFEEKQYEPLLFVDNRLTNNFDLKEIKYLWQKSTSIDPDQLNTLNNSEQEKLENSEDDQLLTIFNLRGSRQEIEKITQNLFYQSELRDELAKQDKHLAFMGSMNITHHVGLMIVLISAYLDLLKENVLTKNEKFALAFPNNNLDFLYVGKILKELALPISYLFLASNNNRSIVDFLNKGDYRLKRKYFRSNSPALDQIYFPNIERLFFELVNQNTDECKELAKGLEEKDHVIISKQLLNNFNKFVQAGYSNNKQTIEQISDWYLRTDYLFDPYTALTLDVLQRFKQKTPMQDKIIVLAVENPLLSPQVSAEALFGKKFIQRKKYNELLTAVSEESGLKIPHAACSSELRPKTMNIDVKHAIAQVSDNLLNRITD